MIRFISRCWFPDRSKPRASGDDPVYDGGDADCSSVNPARAGMIPVNRQNYYPVTGKPRASGDDPHVALALPVPGA